MKHLKSVDVNESLSDIENELKILKGISDTGDQEGGGEAGEQEKSKERRLIQKLDHLKALAKAKAKESQSTKESQSSSNSSQTSKDMSLHIFVIPDTFDTVGRFKWPLYYEHQEDAFRCQCQ